MKSGWVGIVGRPNVGKSTLMNSLLGEKISIVTPKPQTTRHRILGILNEPDCQIIFQDTPGIFEPRYKLQKIMVSKAYLVLSESDLILFMVEPVLMGIEEFGILERLKKLKKKTLLVINKIDTVKKTFLLPVIDSYKDKYDFEAIVPISALKQEGLDLLLSELLKSLPEGEPFYPQDQLTIHPERFFVSEIIREQIFEFYKEEIPYDTTVVIEEFKERSPKDYIRAVIFVEKPSQQGIIIGDKGEAIKKVGTHARRAIEEFLGRKVYLELWVKTKKNWKNNEGFIKEAGYL